MFHNGTQKFIKFMILNTIILVATASCSKAPTGVRAQVKNQQTAINPNTNSSATQQAVSMNANYTFATISLPQANQSQTGYAVNVELQMPSGQILPLTTQHDGVNNFSQGVYNDPANGMQVAIQANCSYNNCDKYTMLVTVMKNGQKLFQTYAISYSNDCRFYVASSSSSVGSFYSDLTAADYANQNIGPMNDLDSCPVQ